MVPIIIPQTKVYIYEDAEVLNSTYFCNNQWLILIVT